MIEVSPFTLLPQRALWWPQRKVLVVSDVHIGKAAHFRKSGIAISSEVNRDNLWRLSGLLLDLMPEHLVVLGDLVHSVYNTEWDAFTDMRANFTGLHLTLIKGNHDVMPVGMFAEAGIEVHDRWCPDRLIFSHEPLSAVPDQTLNVCGHLHPAIRLKGAGKQSLKLPCFWSSTQRLVLPAFGAFTGNSVIKPEPNDRVIAIAENQLIEV